MSGKHSRKSKKLSKILLLMYIIFLLSIILTNGLSKFRSTYTKNSSASITKPLINVVTPKDEENKEILSIENLHNEKVDWNFSINNYNGEKQHPTELNQVALLYKIKINVSDKLNDIEYKIYKVEDGQKTDEISIDEEFELISNSIQEDNYCLEIKTTDKIQTKQELEDGIKISVTANQKIQ